MGAYEERTEYIEGLRRFGEASGYEVSTALLSLLGHPESGMRTVHIAGTNGKGSTAVFLNSICCCAGERTGLFTSPHLVSFRERIRVNDAVSEEPFAGMISKEDVVRLSDIVLDTAKALPERLSPTMFDICLGIALLYFKEKKCSVVILETGLGGRLDSTRAVSALPEVSVITGIGLEHTQYLGNTVEKIAGEKAGILREGTKAVIGRMDPLAEAVIMERCMELSVPFYIAADYESFLNMQRQGMPGKYQENNAACALAAAKLLGMGEEAIRGGLSAAVFPGRMHIISKDPLLILDGAHNPDGVSALALSLKEAFPGTQFTLISAVMADKDQRSMLRIIKPVCKKLICVPFGYERALSPEEYMTIAKEEGIACEKADCFTKALQYVKLANEPSVVFGSLYFIGHCYKELGV